VVQYGQPKVAFLLPLLVLSTLFPHGKVFLYLAAELDLLQSIIASLLLFAPFSPLLCNSCSAKTKFQPPALFSWELIT